MCEQCWCEYGAPRINTEKVRAAVPLIEAVYDLCPVGGNLHIVLDDFNLDDGDVDYCRRVIDSGGCDSERGGPEQLAADDACCKAFSAMTVQERASALALYRRYW